MKYFTILLPMILASGLSVLAGPYAPRVGQPGSSEVSMDDPNIIAWVTGYQDYVIGTHCEVVWQTPDNAIGKAVGIPDTNIVCLGRGGEITLVFDSGIGDSDGNDFVVFENAVTDFFLEIGYVEVSSDGVNFFRFFCDSQTTSTVTSYLDPTNITGFASKYIAGFGTPFDLAEFRGVSPLLDVGDVRYVRIVDIVGDGTYKDSSDNIIYDPYPTIGSAGFDLDGIGVMNMRVADFDNSGAVDGVDLICFLRVWLSSDGDGNWQPKFDVAYPKNGVIDLDDFAVLAKQYGAGVEAL
ncbi:MAG: PEP-CTERM sorting domain-containing protein [Planctomycetes bacterium]|nr:PEP-CTERM sorting domain-containing protein [Planctomycetota bacterium]